MNESRTVIDVQSRLTELGRIRLGEKGNRGAPRKLQQFRLTSYSRELIEQAAALWGGEPQEWTDAPNEGAWQVTTTADTLPVVIPPGVRPFSQAYELWSAGGCVRRCDGENATVRQGNGVRDRSCMCDADARECTITTRVNLMLPDLPGIGVWRLESHGWNAAIELTTALQLFAPVLEQGQFIRGNLRLENRSKKTPGEGTRRFVVPVLNVDATLRQLLEGSGDAIATIEPTAKGKPALPPPPPVPAGGHAVTEHDDGEQRPQLPPPPLPPAATPEPVEVLDAAPPIVEPAPAALPARGPAHIEELTKTGFVPQPAELPPAQPRAISDAQRRRMFAIAREHDVPEPELRAIVEREFPDGEGSTRNMPTDAYERVCDALEGFLPATPDEGGGGEPPPVEQEAPPSPPEDEQPAPLPPPPKPLEQAPEPEPEKSEDDTTEGLIAYGVEKGLTAERARIIVETTNVAPRIMRAMLAQAARDDGGE